MMSSWKLKAAAGVAALALAIHLGAGPALAQFEIEEPEVEQGEIEIEYRGATFSGRPSRPAIAADDDDDDEYMGPAMLENEVLRQGHEIEITGGVTDWWALGVGAEFEEERGEDGTFGDLNLSEIEIENRVEIIPMDDDGGIGAAFFLGYETAISQGEDEDRVALGALVSAEKGRVSATGNLFLVDVFDIRETEIEDGETKITHTPDHWDFEYAWQLKLQKTSKLAIGVEGYGEVPDISDDVAGRNFEKHRVGPVLYLTWKKPALSPMDADADGDADEEEEGSTLNMAFGVLFGLNNNTSDIALKWDFEFEF